MQKVMKLLLMLSSALLLTSCVVDGTYTNGSSDYYQSERQQYRNRQPQGGYHTSQVSPDNGYRGYQGGNSNQDRRRNDRGNQAGYNTNTGMSQPASRQPSGGYNTSTGSAAPAPAPSAPPQSPPTSGYDSGTGTASPEAAPSEPQSPPTSGYDSGTGSSSPAPMSVAPPTADQPPAMMPMRKGS